MKATTAVLCALAATLVGAAPPPGPDVDATFLLLARQANAAEIDMARLALRRSNADEARNFAQDMIADHSQIAEALDAIAPPAHDAPRESEAARLATLRLGDIPAAGFDQQYLLQQVGDHLAAVSLYSTEADEGRNRQLRAFAGHELGMLQAHLQLAVDDAARIGGSSPFKQH
jgi:putative membrane protein